jgi:hypothetical protein
MPSTRACLCLFAIPTVVAILAFALEITMPINLQNLPLHQRLFAHTFMSVIRGILYACEILSDHFGYHYPILVRPILNNLIRPSTRDPRVKVEDLKFDSVPVRIYIPEQQQQQQQQQTKKSPAILFMHGGGWMFMSIDSHDGDCQRFAIELNAVVVSVDYRLIPENKYPAPLDDCFAALVYLMRNADRWNIDANRIAVAGRLIAVHID